MVTDLSPNAPSRPVEGAVTPLCTLVLRLRHSERLANRRRLKTRSPGGLFRKPYKCTPNTVLREYRHKIHMLCDPLYEIFRRGKALRQKEKQADKKWVSGGQASLEDSGSILS